MNNKECDYYFETYINHLVNSKNNYKQSILTKNHISKCNDCQDKFITFVDIFVDIIDEHLLENIFEPSTSFPNMNTFFNNLYNPYIDKTVENIIKYLLIYKKYREKVIDILPFSSIEELYDFYENKLLPAFDS